MGTGPGRRGCDTRVMAERSGSEVTVVVPAGGGATRFGSDKLAAPLAGTTVLEHLLRGLPPEWPVVLVGPARPVERSGTRWVREEPPGGGPLAGVLAALPVVETALVAVVAGDMPLAAPALPVLVAALRAAGPGTDAAVGLDDGGQANPLLAVYRADAVRAAFPDLSEGGRAKRLLGLGHVLVPVRGVAGRDVDTPSDLERLRLEE